MGEGLWQRLKSGFTGGEKGNKKGTSSWLLLVLVCIGILLMFISAKPKEQPAAPPALESKEALAPPVARGGYKESLEKELASLLKRVQGVGDVVVMVTLESGPVYEYEKNRESTGRTTREQDSGGGTRVISESTSRDQVVVARSDGNRESPVVTRELQPRISGVIVIAAGAENPLVCESLYRAVQAGLYLAPNRITVLPMKR